MPAGYKTTLDGDQLFDEALVPPDPDVPEFIPRPVETQYVKPWSDEHAAKFGVPPRQSKSKKRRPGQKHKQSPSLDPLDGLDDLDS